MDREQLLLQCKALTTRTINGVSWLSWDDMLNAIYFLLTLVVIILATIKRNKDKDIETARNSLRIVAGVTILCIGIYNILVYFRIVAYSMSKRIMTGSIQIITGIVFIISSSIFLSRS